MVLVPDCIMSVARSPSHPLIVPCAKLTAAVARGQQRTQRRTWLGLCHWVVCTCSQATTSTMHGCGVVVGCRTPASTTCCVGNQTPAVADPRSNRSLCLGGTRKGRCTPPACVHTHLYMCVGSMSDMSSTAGRVLHMHDSRTSVVMLEQKALPAVSTACSLRVCSSAHC
jgi:hypothetical protein